MIRPESLIPGNFYFFIFYYEENDVVPHIETWIYCDKTCDDDGNDIWLFREPTSTEQPEEEPAEMPLKESQLLHVLDVQGLQKALTEIEDLYPRVQSHELAEPRTNFSELEKQLDEFLKAEKPDHLVITIRYTDKGISLVKRNGGLETVFFIHWKIEPEREQKTRTFFQNRNLIPDQDYLASRPRVRVLSYPLPMENSNVIDLVINAFKEIYDIKNTDQFRYESRIKPTK